MKKTTSSLRAFIPVALLATLVQMTACSEVKEVGTYDNWQLRNEAYTDSISKLVGTRVVTTEEDADNMTVGTLYAIQTSASTNMKKEYVYAKKLTANSVGLRPYYTDKVSVFYHGTFLNGIAFDGNFNGYSGADQKELDGTQMMPTEFDTPADFTVNSLVVGWIYSLQYMREGERWMVYVPYASGYGEKAQSSVPGFSTLVFDMVLKQVYDR